LSRLLAKIIASWRYRMPTPTRISRMPITIALLNGNIERSRAGRFGSRSALPIRDRDGGGACEGCGA
jgi:hypothetical protein